ncbi:MAG TPA: L,D-transpeptidase family protein [bacterium]|nr:L,D-transpeptidase family protein [bacterium]
MKSKPLIIAGAAAAVALAGAILYGVHYFTVKSTLAQAQKIYVAGDIQQALPMFEDVYARSSRSALGAEALGFLCQGYYSLENYDKSVQFADQLLSANKGPNWNAMALYWLGCSLGKKKDLGKASLALTDLVTKYKTSGYMDDAMLELAKVKRAQGYYLEALELLKGLIDHYPNSNLIKQAVKEYGDLNVAILFSPIKTRFSEEYTVTKGDTVEGVAKKFNTTADLVRLANGLGERPRLQVGDRMKVNVAKFSLLIDKSQNTLTLLADGDLFKVYSVGTGKMNSTPVGTFRVTNKLANPPWYKPGGGVIPFGSKENLLGTRWMGISSPGYGIHGTWEPETVGKQSSAGCVRMINSEVEELFRILVPGTEVTILD